MIQLGRAWFLALFSFGAWSSTAPLLTEVHLQVDVNAPSCEFDTKLSSPKRLSDSTVGSRFVVKCSQADAAYQLETTLSPFSEVSTSQRGGYAVRLFVRQDGPACHGDKVHHSSVLLDSHHASSALTATASTEWSYCIQLLPNRDGTPPVRGEWPMAGAIPITIAALNSVSGLPVGAERFEVGFEHNSAELDAAGKRMIDAMFLQLPPNAKDLYQLQLHAHASWVGEAAYNRVLSERRLAAVQEYLRSAHQIPLEHIHGQAWGDHRPQAINTEMPEGPENRRVDVMFIPQTSYRF